LILPRAASTPFIAAQLVASTVGAAATLLAAYASVRMGAQIGVGLVLIVALVTASMLGFLLAPHVMVAAVIPLCALIPALKVFATPLVGPLKDLVGLGAIVAAVAILAFDRRGRARRSTPDGWALAAVGVLLLLYLVNIGGGHGLAWAQGVRLIGEPLLLLVAGSALPNPRRTLRWAMASLISTTCLVAAYGLVQQAVGKWTLVAWGYSFSEQIRTYNGHLRSFGTLDDPFAYAALLLLGLAATLFCMRRGLLASACGSLIVLGLAASWVRTAYLVGIALLGLWICRRGYHTSAVLLWAAAVGAAAFVLVAGVGATEATSYHSSTSNLTLNGRTSAWKAALGQPSQWLFGRGVGSVGTAAYRAGYTISPPGSSQAPARAVDSGYFALIADVGLAGLAILLALLGRLLQLATTAIRKGRAAGWAAVSILAVLMLDAVTRSTFTGFPAAFLGFLFVGVALAAGAADDDRARAGAVTGRVPARR
jgi:O-antigen ligase